MSKTLKIILAIIGLIILWVLTLYFRRAPIEQDLINRVKATLNRPEFNQVAVSFQGRDGSLTGEVSSQLIADEAEQLAKKLWGVRVINNQLNVPVEKQMFFTNLQGYFQNGKFIFGGVIPDEAWRAKLIQLAEKAFGAGKLVDQLSIDPSVRLPDFFEKAFAAFLGLKGIDEAGFSIGADKFVLKGKVPTDEIKTRLGAELAKALAPLQVQNELQVISAAAAKPSLQDVQKFFSANTIEFDFGSSRLSSQSRQTLDRAFELINQVPEANFEIEGHTDNIGSDAYNLRLSRARAISVRLYLLERGIKPERLSVNAFGEKQPKANNDTEEGRQRNRRAEFRLK
jgi:OOP family OmpA-OmpF porin